MFTEISTFLSGLSAGSVVIGYILATALPFPVISTWIGNLWSSLGSSILDGVASTVASHVVKQTVAAPPPAAAPAATTVATTTTPAN